MGYTEMWSRVHSTVRRMTVRSVLDPTPDYEAVRPALAVRSFTTVFSPKPIVSYGVKRSKAYKDAKVAARKSAVRARRLEEEKGMLLDPRKCLQMELKRNSGIGWYRSFQIIKHLEMHKNGKGPLIDTRMRDKITQIANV